MATGPADLSPGSLRRRFADAFVPSRRIFWADLTLSAGLGWGAFLLSGAMADATLSLLALGVATLALYRAVLFIHEVAHLRPGAIPGFRTVWNLVAGFPLMVPSLMYVGSHSDHHKRSTYGTALDPEYEPIAHWSPLRIVASTLTMPLLPAALAFRWGLLGPLSWLFPPLRRFAVTYGSTLVINPSYRREAPRGRAARRWVAEEIGAGLTCWAGIALVATGTVAVEWALRWYAVGASILVLNHLRTLAAHHYENAGETMDVTGQLLDTVNVPGVPGLTALLAPVGLRYHGLHHLVPSMPYHSLGRIHRTLMAELPPDSPYRRTEARGLVATLRELLAAARENARSGLGPTVLATYRHGGLSAARRPATAATGSERRGGPGAGAAAR